MAKLIVQDAGSTFLLDLPSGEALVVGRSHDCDVPISAPRSSRRHAAFLADGAGHRVSDLDSTNGTLLNGAPFKHDTRLADGDVVDIGGCKILYRTLPGPNVESR